MKIEVVASPADFFAPRYSGAIVVVIDVLRATSTIVTALHHGCLEVIPVAEVEEAFALAQKFPRAQVCLGGERKAVMVKGFDLGNSPAEYTPEAVYGKTVILTTTNGTRAMQYTREAKETIILSFLNMRAVTAHLQHQEVDLYILCAGRDGFPALEDTVCAGLLVERLMDGASAHREADASAREAQALARQYKNDLLAMMRLSQHGAYLERLGFAADLDICARLNAIEIVPLLSNGSIQR